MNTKTIISRVAKPRVRMPLLVFMSEIKTDPSLMKSNFLLLNCVNIVNSSAIVIWIEKHFFSYRFASKSMLPACLFGTILVVNVVCN